MKKIKGLFGQHWPLLILLAFEILLIRSNYITGTWLVGWDSTQPELNFTSNLSRVLSPVWQEYRGLGVLDGMAHGANIAHLFYVWLLSLFLELNQVRYAFVFLMHFVGGAGMYFLLKRLFKLKLNQPGLVVVNLISFFGALFYLLSPITIQMFFAPLELFIIHFGFLPWLILVLIKYLKSGVRKDLVLLALVNFLAVSQAHVPTIFIVYVLTVFVFLLFHILYHKNHIKRAVAVVAILFTINAFWGLPYIYSAIGSAGEISSTKNNQLSNPEVVLRNKAYGDIKNVALMHGFSLDYEDWDGEVDFNKQMQVWSDHWEKPESKVVGWIAFALTIAGIVVVLIEKRKRIYPFIVLYVVAFLNLASEVPVVNIVWNLLREIPFYEEIFRFTFTKFGILYIFASVVLIVAVLNKLMSVKAGKMLGFLAVLVLSIAIVYNSTPVFKGGFLYQQIKQEIPSEYFEVFDFFEERPKGRVVLLPYQSYWGWEFMEWGYRGSGFTWQGISQPTLHPAFNPWSSLNETFYHELSTAIYGEDPEALMNVFAKYDVTYALIDESITAPGQDKSILRFPETHKMLTEINAIEVFKQNFLTVYKLPNTQDSFVYAPEKYSVKSGDTVYARVDSLFDGDYISSVSGTTYYPFSDLFRENIKGITYENGRLVLTRELNSGSGNYYLAIQTQNAGDNYVTAAEVKLSDSKLIINFENTQLYLDRQLQEAVGLGQFEIDIPSANRDVFVSIGGATTFIGQGSAGSLNNINLIVGEPITVKVYDASVPESFGLTDEFTAESFKKCWERNDKGEVVTTDAANTVSIKTKDAVGCLSTNLGQIQNDTLLYTSLLFKSPDHARPHFCVNAQSSEFECLNDEVFYNTYSSNTFKNLESYTELPSGDIYWLDVSARPSDAQGVTTSISYQTPTVIGYDLIDSYEFSNDIWESVAVNRAYKLQDNSELAVKIPATPINVNFVRSGGEITNCDLFERGSISKDIDNKGSVSYQAKDRGAACDYTVLPISTKNAYILRFVGESISGRPAKFYLYNKSSERNDLEILLPEGVFDSSYMILPWEDLEEGGYTLNLETRSFGKEVSENRTDKVEVYQLPLEWLSSIAAGPGSGLQTVSNSLVINEVNKTGTYKYSVDTKGDGLLVLTQGYDKGWTAISQGKILDHVKVNGWANGWTVDDNPKIIIIFWPQYLQFVGFALLIGTFIFLLIPKRSSKII